MQRTGNQINNADTFEPETRKDKAAAADGPRPKIRQRIVDQTQHAGPPALGLRFQLQVVQGLSANLKL